MAKAVKIPFLADVKDAVKNIDKLEKKLGTLHKPADAFGRLATKAFQGLVVASAAAAAAVTGFAIKSAVDIDEAMDRIRVATGATGAALADLKKSFQTVFADVPASAQDVGRAMADLATRTGLTGSALETLTKQSVVLAKITGEDVGEITRNVTRVFGDWSIATQEQSEAMDWLFKVSQQTGVGVSELSDTVVKFGAPLRQLGFSFKEGTALLGKWEKEGVNVETGLAGLRKAFATFAKQGKDPAKALKDTIKAIQNAGSAAEANKLAISVFGAKAGPDLAAAIKEGRFSIDELLKSLESSHDTILTAAKDTYDLSERWTMLKNKLMIALEPLGRTIIDELSAALDKVDWNAVAAKVEAFAKKCAEAVPKIINFARDAIGKVVEVAKWLVEHKELVVGAVVAIGAAFAGWKIASVVGQLAGIATQLGSIAGFKGLSLAAPLSLTVSSIAITAATATLAAGLLTVAKGAVGEKYGPVTNIPAAPGAGRLAAEAAEAWNRNLTNEQKLMVENYNYARRSLVDRARHDADYYQKHRQATKNLEVAAMNIATGAAKAGVNLQSYAASGGQRMYAWAAASGTELGKRIAGAGVTAGQAMSGGGISARKALGDGGLFVASGGSTASSRLTSGASSAASAIRSAGEALRSAGSKAGDYIRSASYGLMVRARGGYGGRYVEMQSGGIVTRPTFALIGEAGPEAVIPLSERRSVAAPVINIHVHGSVVTERELDKAILESIRRARYLHGAVV